MDIVFCEQCHESIPDGDFDAGRAVRVDGSSLHVACALQRGGRPHAGPARAALVVALLALGGAAYALAQSGALGGGESKGPPVDARIRDAEQRAVAQAKDATETSLQAERAARGRLETAVGSAREEIRELKDAVNERLLKGDREAREGAANLQERLVRLESDLSQINSWITLMAKRAEEAARTGESPRSPELVKPPVTRAPEEGTKPEAVKPEAVKPEAGKPPAPGPAEGGSGRGPEYETDFQRWVERLKDPTEGIAFSATIELGRMKDLRAVPPLVDVLKKHKDFYVRLGAATSLGELLAVDGVPALVDALEDRDELVRTSADESLRKITEPLLTATDKEDLDFQANMTVNERRKVQNKWRSWWKANEEALRSKRSQPART